MDRETTQRIDEAVRSVYGRKSPTPRAYQQALLKEHGAAGSAFLALAQGRPLEWRDDTYDHALYAAKNATPELSRLISSYCNTELHRRLLRWLAEHIGAPPKRLVEIGCDNGLFAACVARYWPATEVYGIDSNPGAIASARAEATQFGIDPQHFVVADLTVSSSCSELFEPCDLVVLPWVLHHLQGGSAGAWQAAADNLHGLLADDGVVLSIDRFPQTEQQQLELIETLRPYGLEGEAQPLLHVGMEVFPVTRFRAAESFRSTRRAVDRTARNAAVSPRRKFSQRTYPWLKALLDDELEAGFSQERNPRRYPFGLFQRDLVGSFHWARSPEERFALLRYALPRIQIADDYEVLDEMAAELGALAPELEHATVLTDELRHQIDKIFVDARIEWWGHFDELVSSDDAFARDVRESFWSNLNREGSAPIPLWRLTEFARFLGSHS